MRKVDRFIVTKKGLRRKSTTNLTYTDSIVDANGSTDKTPKEVLDRVYALSRIVDNMRNGEATLNRRYTKTKNTLEHEVKVLTRKYEKASNFITKQREFISLLMQENKELREKSSVASER